MYSIENEAILKPIVDEAEKDGIPLEKKLEEVIAFYLVAHQKQA